MQCSSQGVKPLPVNTTSGGRDQYMNRHVTDGLHHYSNTSQLHKTEISFARTKFGVKSSSSYIGTGRPLLWCTPQPSFPALNQSWSLLNTRHLMYNYIKNYHNPTLYIHVTVHCNRFLFNNQPDALINKIYSVTKLYVFRASSLPIIRSFLLYIRHW